MSEKTKKERNIQAERMILRGRLGLGSFRFITKDEFEQASQRSHLQPPTEKDSA